jgi:sortase (surface protein transpeptidase)
MSGGSKTLRGSRPTVVAVTVAAVLFAALVVSLARPIPAAVADIPGGPHTSSDAGPPAAHNGRLPAWALRNVGGTQLAPDAAAALERLLAHARRDGVTIAVTGGYRTYEQQVDVKRRKGWLAATPGRSMHGWGTAIDVDMRVTDLDWLRKYAASYGWVNPPWAQPGGSKPEPWHWEYVGATEVRERGSGAVGSYDSGALVGSIRLEPVGAPVTPWIDVHEGFEGLEEGARHYPGTAGPGAPGNFAVAGYHLRPGAPLAGVDRLRAGDTIRVRAPGGEELRYTVVKQTVLTDADGWAVGPDPLEDGSAVMVTLTTGTEDGRLLVVWGQLLAPGHRA